MGGCDEVFGTAQKQIDDYNAKKRQEKTELALSIVLPILSGLLLLGVIIAIMAKFYMHRIDESNEFSDMPTGPKVSLKKRISKLFSGSGNDGEGLLDDFDEN